MKFFNFEGLGDREVNVERDDGTTLQGTPAKILPQLVQWCLQGETVEMAMARQDEPGGVSSHGTI